MDFTQVWMSRDHGDGEIKETGGKGLEGREEVRMAPGV